MSKRPSGYDLLECRAKPTNNTRLKAKKGPERPQSVKASVMSGTETTMLRTPFPTGPVIRVYRRGPCWIEGTLAVVYAAAGMKLLLSR